ncbi:MAG: M20/M25/M40 family metallo-hydrolase [Chitinophagaceae bacterium]|nr:M20/M25/M40 family metallo-hydrolase [Chitinophagaceae bacterium]
MKYLLTAFAIFCTSVLTAQTLSAEENRIIAEVRRHHAANLELLKEIVNINSGSLNIAGVKAVGERLAQEYRKIGFHTEWISLPDSVKRAGHLVAWRKGQKGKRVMMIGHLDTVFEPDMEANPFRLLNDSLATGQGVVDMKGGNVMMLAICQALHNLKLIDDATIVCYYTGDEESTGEPEWLSRQDFIARAKTCDIALGFETAQNFNTVAVGRRGSSSWKLTTEGRQSHSAGMFGPNASYGAIYEAARILTEIRRQLEGEKYLTISPGVIAGGTELNSDDKNFRASVSGKTNIIAPAAVVHGDLRFLGEAQKQAAREKMKAIAASSLRGTRAQFEFYDGFPSMEPKPGNYALVKTLNDISLAMGLGEVKAGDPGSRGAGDISWVAEYVDCLDGLGASGGGAHAPGEVINLKELPRLTERAALLLYRLTR